MKHFKYLHNSILGLALASAGTIALAADAGQAYFSAFIGNSEVDVEDEGYSASGSDLSFRIGGGYQVHENIAIEGYYIDYGKAEDTVEGYDISVETTSIQLQGLVMYPVTSSFDVYGKLGVAFWDAEACFETLCDDETDNNGVYGLGGSFHASDNVTIRAEYEHLEFYDFEVDTIMAGINYAF
jgi:OOP family OmpA-OmpF porin